MRITIELHPSDLARVEAYRQYLLAGDGQVAQSLRAVGFSQEAAVYNLLRDALWRYEYLLRMFEPAEPAEPAAPAELDTSEPAPVPEWLRELEREVSQ